MCRSDCSASALASRFIPNVRVEHHEPFDLVGFHPVRPWHRRAWRSGFRSLGLDFLPVGVVAALLVVGAVSTVAYVIHARRTPAPILDLSLLKLPTFRASIVGGFLFRLGVGALPFLLPLLLQIGFDLTPFQSGLITFTGALGSMFMKAAVTRVLKRFGYRDVLLYNSLISGAFLAACASFVPGMPFAAMIAILLTGGFFRSLQFTSINTIAYAEIEPALMSRATTIVAAAQQLSLSTGVAVGALVVEITLRLKACGDHERRRFSAGISGDRRARRHRRADLCAAAPDAGAELSGRKAAQPKVANLGDPEIRGRADKAPPNRCGSPAA